MATDQFTVKGSIVFNTEGFERAMNRASRKLKTFGNAASRSGREITSTLSIPMALLAGAAIKVATEFDLAQRKIQALNPRGNIDKLTKSARELGASTIFTASEVSGLQLSLAKLGKSETEIQNLQGTILKFAQAMDQDLATSGEFIVKTMNRYAESLKLVGDQQEQAAYVGNLFASVAANTALNAENLASSLNYVGSEAAVYGITLEETAAILGLLADRGFDASRGGTALRRILAQLGKDGYSASEAIEALLEPSRGFSAELEQFGLRGAGPAAALGGLREEFETLKDTIVSSSGFLNEFALILDNSLSASFKRVKSAAQEVGIAFTEEFGDTIRLITSNITRLLRKFAALPKPIKRIVVGITAFVAVSGPLLAAIGALSLALGSLFLAFGPVGVAAMAVSAILGTAVLGIVTMTENTDTATMSMDDLRRKVYESNDAFKELAKSELVTRERLEEVARLQFEIESLNAELDRLNRANVGSSYDRQIDKVITKIRELKTEQAALNDEFKKYLDTQDDIKKAQEAAIASGTFTGPLVPDYIADGEGGVKDNLGVLLETLKQQRQEILNRKNEIIAGAKGGLLFDPEQLRKEEAALKEIEGTLKLLGITFNKEGKEKALPFTENLIKAFEELNPEIAGIVGEQTKLQASIAKLERVRALLTERSKEEYATQGFINEETEKSLVMNAALLEYYKAQDAYTKEIAKSNKSVSELLSDLEQVPVGPSPEDVENAAILNERMGQLNSLALSIGDTFANAISSSIVAAVEGTERFAKAIKGSLISAITALITKLAALAIAWGIIALLVTIASAGSNVGAAASAIKDAGFVNFALGNSGLGGFTRSAQGGGGLRTQGYLSGSDIVLGTRRGATALDRIYG